MSIVHNRSAAQILQKSQELFLVVDIPQPLYAGVCPVPNQKQEPLGFCEGYNAVSVSEGVFRVSVYKAWSISTNGIKARIKGNKHSEIMI
jgi:hypothetical protein